MNRLVQENDVMNTEPPVYDEPPTAEEIKAYEQKMAQPVQRVEEIDQDAGEVEEAAEESDIQDQETEQETEIEAPKTPQQKRFATLRDQKEKLEREVAEAKREAAENMRLVQQYQQYYSQQPQEPVQQQPPQPRYSFKDDDLVEWKDIKRYTDDRYAELAAQNANLQRELQSQTVAQKVIAEFPDFYKVASTENCAKLRKLDPALADTLYYTQDPYLQAKSTYTLIKKLGIIEEEPRGAKETAEKFESNKKRAKSGAGSGVSSPLSQAQRFNEGLTESAADALWREMQECAKRA